MLKLLLVENDIVDQMAFSRVFETMTYAPCFTIVDSVAGALEVLKSEQYDIVIVDYHLDDGSGLDILQSVDQDLPVIIVTGAGSEAVAVEALRLGAADYVIKDVERSYLKLLPSIIERAVRAKVDEKMHTTLSQAVMNSGDSVCITDLNGSITFVNNTFCRMFGYNKDKVIGQKYGILYSPNQHPLEDNEFTNYESIHIRSDGTPIHVSMTRSHIRDDQGRPFAYSISVRDISHRIRMETVLRRSEQHLRSILDSQNTFVLRTDLEGQYTYVNNVMYEQFRWMYPNMEDIIGSNVLDTVVEEDRQKAFEAAVECLKTPGKSIQVTLRKPSVDNGYFWGLWEFVAVKNREGKPLEIQCVGIDITDRILAEKRTFELSLEKERLKLLTTFIQNVSHEFRTPLTKINIANSLINLIDDPLKQREKTSKIEIEVNRISELVDMLMLVSKLEHGLTIERISADLNEITTLAYGNLVSNQDEDPTIITNFGSDLPYIMVDTQFIITAIHQIIDNAIRYTPVCGEIRLETRSVNGYVSLCVYDNGIGITEDDLPRIFDSFWRKDEAHSSPGFGLGLTIAKKIIELHQGEIIVNSEYGSGTRVEVRLPISQ